MPTSRSIGCGFKTNPNQVTRVFPRLMLDKKGIATNNPLFPARSIYFGFIYESRAKTPLTKETKNIFVTDIFVMNPE